jgi:adenine specific DNA methylase Mod
MTKEQRFYSALKDLFVGAKVEGESGYINLMRIKSRYFEKGVFPKLQEDVDTATAPFPTQFREELFDKLYSFFSRYFSESGSIYFRYTPLHQNVYEKVYTDDKDVMLFWKTHMLYYVKTDRLFKNMDAQVDNQKFFFDVSTLEHKKSNEKREIVYSFKERRKDGTIVFTVGYSEKGKKTKLDEIQNALKKDGHKVGEDILERAFRVFRKQSEVDYFINKNAKAFLEEQFNLWLYQYVFSGESEWTETRTKQLQVLKDIAFKIIAFISQFEDELVRIWNKPKFVLDSNYVITLDRIADKDLSLVEQLAKHPNFKAQVKEWEELGMVDGKFKTKEIVGNDFGGKHLRKEWRHLPVDTKYFKDVEIEILGRFENLDAALDGWLIKSEDYQALTSIVSKFRGRVQAVYVDPPFNTGDDFAYVDNYQDSTWLTLMQNRLVVAHEMLSDRGSFYLHLDENAIHLGRMVMDGVFGKDRFRREIIWDIQVLSGFKVKGAQSNWILGHQAILFYTKNDKYYFEKLLQPQSLKYLESFNKTDAKGLKYQVAHGRNIYKHEVEKRGKPFGDVWPDLRDIIDVERPFMDVWKELTAAVDLDRPLKSVWSDIMSFQQQPTSSERVDFDTQKPEKLLERIIKASAGEKQIVLDFYAGSGTTAATAQKINRKWIAIEMGDQFVSFILPRMKRTLSGHQTVVSRENGYEGGGMFKYFDVEQYEDALRRTVYDDSDLFNDPKQDPYNQFVFLRDLKMLDVLHVDLKHNKVKVDLTKHYKNIDIAETLSNLTGKWIKRITADTVEFEDGEKIDLKNLDYRLIKPLIWW